MADKIHMSVVRDTGYQRGEFNTRGRHNERKNEAYGNGDIVPERITLNVHFHQNLKLDGTPETYEETYNRLLVTDTVSEKWQKPESAQFAEMVFDVNTEYFDGRGGYEYAKSFYEEAYRFALNEIGSEDYVISAVLHADERHSALSEQLGRDVYHYHLHVVYVPVVIKEERWSTRCKDPALVGTVKEVIPQIAHSKKWPIKVPVERNGKRLFVNAYSLLQDRYFEHMRAAGFDGFERGERGSTAEHLEVLDYKIQQDKQRLAALEKQTDAKRAEVEHLVAATKVRAGISATQIEIDAMARPSKSGKTKIVDNADWERVAAMAKRCTILDEKAGDTKRQISSLQLDRDTWKSNYDRLWGEVREFVPAIRKIPNRLRAFLEEQKQAASQNREESR